MDLRIRKGFECWNQKSLEEHAAQQTKKEDANKKALPLNVIVDVGQIACNGCQDGICTASISRTVIRPVGQIGKAVGERIEEIPNFERERPADFDENNVIDIRRAAA